MKKSIPILILLAALTLLAACNPLTDVQEKQYTDYAALTAAGEQEKGWAPDWLPTSAHNIQLKTNLDTNAILLAFDFDPAEKSALSQRCAPTTRPLPPTLSAAWWPTDLLTNPAAQFYQCDAGYLALLDARGYYWTGAQAPADALSVNELYAHPEDYLHLDGQRVTVIGYVDFDNIHDLRQSYYAKEGIGFVRKPGQTADAIFNLYFPPDANPHPLFDKLYALRPEHEQTGLKVLATGVLRSFQKPTNFTNRTGYALDVASPEDVVIVP